MNLIDIHHENNYDSAILQSVDILSKGGLIVYPTDTVYGIGSDIYNHFALSRIAEIKQRGLSKQFIILVNSVDMLKEFAILNNSSEYLIKRYWPGPLTLIIKSRILLNNFVLNDENSIAVRMPNNRFCLDLINKYKKPISSTSANIHGLDQGRFKDIMDNFGESINLYIYSGEQTSILPSTILDVTKEDIKIIREGALKIEL